MTYQSFLFLHEKLSSELLRLFTMLGPTSEREKEEVNISCSQCVMSRFSLAFGWLALCGILLVVCPFYSHGEYLGSC